MTPGERAAARERCAKATVEWDCIKYADWQETVLHEQQQWAAKYAAKVLADLPLALDALDAAEQQLTDLRAEVDEFEALRDISGGVCGLTVNGVIMHWGKVVDLYLPSLKKRLALQPSGEGEGHE